MATFHEREEQRSAGSSLNAVLLTAAKFFGKDGSIPYDTPEPFLAHGKKLTPSDVEGMRKCISYAKEGLKTDGGSDIRTDVAGLQYRFYQFYRPKSRPGAKLVLTAGMVRLMSDYQNGKVTIDFTLDDLIDEARKSTESTTN